MLRKIVLVRSHEWLHESWATRSFAAASMGLQSNVKVKGVEFQEDVYAVPVYSRVERGGTTARIAAAAPAAPVKPPHESYAVVARFDDEEAIDRLKQERPDDVAGVFSDPPIQATPASYCRTGPEGTFRDVQTKLGVPKLSQAKLTGKKVRVAIVDTGIHGASLSPQGKPIQKSISSTVSYSPQRHYKPGSNQIDHGTMCAFDVLLSAPDAVLLDFALLQSTAGPWSAFLSDALAAFAHLIDEINRRPGPLVVNNSWGLFDRSTDAKIGSPQNYSANPNHPFNQITGALVAAGADVLFAAGNCGQECPDGRCRNPDDVGPGASIHGANSHPSVITVAAVTVKGTRLGYSSQGPGDLSDRKPDIAAYSHFAGSGVYQADGGTSAACPVAAGLVAALRQGFPRLTPAQIKGLLQKGANSSWSYDLGYGIISAERSLALAKAAPGSTPAGTGSKRSAAAGSAEVATGAAWMMRLLSPEERAAYTEKHLKPGAKSQPTSKKRHSSPKAKGKKSGSKKKK